MSSTEEHNNFFDRDKGENILISQNREDEEEEEEKEV